MNHLVKIFIYASSILVYNITKAQAPKVGMPSSESSIGLPDGYSATKITINPNAGEDIKQQFYAKSKGQNTYTVYRDEKGTEVSEEQVKELYQKETKNNHVSFPPKK